MCSQLVKIKELDNLRGYVSLGYSGTYGKQGIASVLNIKDSRQLPSSPKQLRNLPFGLSSFRKIRKKKVQPEYWIMSGLGRNLPWGQAMEHSRRSFTWVSSNLEADLTSLCWSAKDLHTLHRNRVIMEISSAHTLEALNNPQWFPGLVAEKIAVSVTKDGRFQSYIARGGPSWLNDTILEDASNSPSTYPRRQLSLLRKYEAMVSTHFTLYRVFIFQAPIGVCFDLFSFSVFSFLRQ
ncbi:hypothetical protein DY000_02059540 [Brassica cretica]|uniref:Uncharacterized protein n=1 Tax=Brassica cretica TaxID=69181 RepID=A0ABQ7ANZ9_BRACR|nr:hypothetical protein DY000_02059540 [Brassica cretica]